MSAGWYDQILTEEERKELHGLRPDHWWNFTDVSVVLEMEEEPAFFCIEDWISRGLIEESHPVPGSVRWFRFVGAE